MSRPALTLPWPDKRLNPNHRTDRRYLADVRSVARNAGYVAAKEAGWSVPDRTPLHLFLTFCPPDRRRRDDDNLVSSFKWARDGIFAALGVDDSNVKLTTYGLGKRVEGGAVIVRLEVIPKSALSPNGEKAGNTEIERNESTNVAERFSHGTDTR